MHRRLSHLLRSGIAVAVATAALGIAPAIVSSASAGSVSAECQAARTAYATARSQQTAAGKAVAKARKALKKARHQHRPAKVRKAKKALRVATVRYQARVKATKSRGARMGYACSAPSSATRANGTGRTLALLALADGLDLGVIDLGQLTGLLERFLPGLADDLSPAQLSALLTGFNAVAGSGLSLANAATILGGAFSPADLTALLGGAAGPELLSDLAEHLLGQLTGLGGLPIPGGFDPGDVLETLSGLLGGLDAAQLGQLLGLVTTALGGGSALDLGQLTDLLDGLVPGLSDGLDPATLTAILGAVNGGGLDAGTLTNLLGGAFSAGEITQVLGGTAGTALLGAVIAQVMAQLGTLDGGAFELPTGLDLTTLTNLVSTVTDLLDAVTGGGIIPVVCGIVPIPLVCP
ncbi:MAG: hypothetical protein J7518_10505 [Nocardioidaceae bacterium]|nr:hypothetical protein [Nocardioidaceae bacterium]